MARKLIFANLLIAIHEPVCVRVYVYMYSFVKKSIENKHSKPLNAT